MIIIHVSMQIKPEKEQEYLATMETLIEASRLEEGNISYDLCKKVNEDNNYLLIEVWEDQEAVDFHNNTEHFKSYITTARAEQFAAVPPRAIVYDGEISPN